MPVSFSPLKAKPRDLTESNHFLDKKLVKLINSNDKIIQNRYTLKNSMIKFKSLPVVTVSLDSDLLVERQRTDRHRFSNCSKFQPIEMKCSKDKVYYYKLPCGNHIRNEIKNSLTAVTAANHSRRHNNILSETNEGTDLNYFTDVRKVQASKIEQSRLRTHNLSIKIEHLPWDKIKDSKHKRFINKTPTYYTGETGLSPDSFVSNLSSVFSTKRIGNDRLHFENESLAGKSKLNRDREARSSRVSIDFRNELLKRKKKLKYPLLPNHVNTEELPSRVNFFENEDPLFILSHLYSDFKISLTGNLYSRTFSGSLKFAFVGSKYDHRFYTGCFGCVDGINSLYKLSVLFSRDNALNADYLMDPLGMSRESFLALSHMFNLRKLVGKPNLPITDHFSLRSISDNSPMNSGEFGFPSVSRRNSESVDSIDFALVSKFTDRIVREVTRQEGSTSKSITKDDLQVVANQLLCILKSCKSVSTVTLNLDGSLAYIESDSFSESSESTEIMELVRHSKSTSSSDSFIYMNPIGKK